jgi:alpha-ketoglutarate-dependent taurine dioxygenase
MKVERVGQASGARVHGVDLGTELDETTFSMVRSALNEHSVLVFPGQHVEPAA